MCTIEKIGEFDWDIAQFIHEIIVGSLCILDLNSTTHLLKFIPVYSPMPFFQSRLRLCDLDVAPKATNAGNIWAKSASY